MYVSLVLMSVKSDMVRIELRLKEIRTRRNYSQWVWFHTPSSPNSQKKHFDYRNRAKVYYTKLKVLLNIILKSTSFKKLRFLNYSKIFRLSKLIWFYWVLSLKDFKSSISLEILFFKIQNSFRSKLSLHQISNGLTYIETNPNQTTWNRNK